MKRFFIGSVLSLACFGYLVNAAPSTQPTTQVSDRLKTLQDRLKYYIRLQNIAKVQGNTIGVIAIQKSIDKIQKQIDDASTQPSTKPSIRV
jgi:hypothetical protein